MTPGQESALDAEAVARYAGPEYRRLLDAARRSLERTGGSLSAVVTVKQPDDAERKAIIGITGQYRPEAATRSPSGSPTSTSPSARPPAEDSSICSNGSARRSRTAPRTGEACGRPRSNGPFSGKAFCATGTGSARG